jgi:hypothetical protein
MKPSWRWFEIGLVLFGLLAHLYVVFSPANSLMNWYTTDDAFYYYKVAVNITSGAGVTFDGINRTNGFQPLWMLVCTAVFWLAKFDLLLPLRVLVIVSAFFSIGTGLLLYRLLRKFISVWIAALIAVVWTFSTVIHGTVVMNGMEAVISAFFIVLLLTLAIEWHEGFLPSAREIILGLVAGLTILSRLDNIFVVMLLGTWFMLRSTGAWLRNLFVSDLALVFITGLLSYYIRLRAGPFYDAYSYSMPWLLVIGFLLKPLAFYSLGLYQPLKSRLTWHYFLRGGLTVTFTSTLMGGILLALQQFGIFPNLPRAVLILTQIIIIDWVGTLLGMLGLRMFVGWLTPKLASGEEPNLLSGRVWKPVLRSGLSYFLPVGALLGAYLAWNYFFVGTLMPVSGSIKHWWSLLSNTVYGTVIHTVPELFGIQGSMNAWKLAFSPFTLIRQAAEKYLGLAAPLVSNALILLLAALLVVFAFLQRRWIAGLLNRKGLFVFFLALYCQIFYYSATSYIHVRSWYWVGEMIFTVLVFGVLLEAARLTLDRLHWKPWLGKIAVAVLGVTVLASFAGQLLQLFPDHLLPESRDAYLAETRFLEGQTATGSLIGMTGGGTTGYFIQGRTILNMDGLINSPEYFRALKDSTAGAFWDRMKLNYVYAKPYVVEVSDPYRQLLAGRLEEQSDFAGIVLYRYLPRK